MPSAEYNLFLRIQNNEKYSVEVDGEQVEMNGKRLKAYLHQNRGRINASELLNTIPKKGGGIAGDEQEIKKEIYKKPTEQPGGKKSSQKT